MVTGFTAAVKLRNVQIPFLTEYHFKTNSAFISLTEPYIGSLAEEMSQKKKEKKNSTFHVACSHCL